MTIYLIIGGALAVGLIVGYCLGYRAGHIDATLRADDILLSHRSFADEFRR